MRLIAIAAGLLIAGPAAAQTETPTPEATETPEASATPTPAPEPAKAKGAVAETKGGLTVRSDDGNFEFKAGGRIHLDAVSLDPADSDAYQDEGGAYFRRARLTLSGKAYGWDWKFENDFADAEAATDVACDSTDPSDCDASTTGTNSFRDMYIATKVPFGKVTLGQFKPLRGMEELTSSNEITMMERPFASASGMFSGRQFAIGGKYQGGGDSYTYGVAVQNNSVLKGADTRTTEEPLVSARGTYAPLNEEGMVVHLGVSGSMENGNTETGARLRGRGKLPATDLGTSRTLAEAGAATNAEDKDAMHAGLELAGAFGPAYLQAEYVQAMYTDAYDDVDGSPEDASVTAYYVMASVFVTGESKPYKGGVFKSPKPTRPTLGAIELKARYDAAENQEQPKSSDNERQLSVITVGANWYVNPAVRFMLEYSMGMDQTTQVDGEFVQPSSVALRTQFAF